jgi:hypothetical protein
MVYDVLLVGLSNYKTAKRITRWVRGIHATSLTEASQKAIQLHPAIGCIPSPSLHGLAYVSTTIG